jgi:hypothetical protein
MSQLNASLDFSETSAQVNTIPKSTAPDIIPQPLAEWVIRILARLRATNTQPDS